MIKTPDTNSICPIFFQKTGTNSLEQVGSSVILQVKNKTFLLTAAHVTDLLEHGELFIPAIDGFIQLYGSYSAVKLPIGWKREHDKVDIAYFKLDQNVYRSIHPTIKALARNDLHLAESLVEKDIYTFSGYPVSRAKSKGEQHRSEIFSYTGSASPATIYEKLEYDSHFHILIDFNRQQFCTNEGTKQIPPHPKGISGGAVFSWPKDYPMRKDNPRFYLVGIAHTYKKKKKYLLQQE